MTDQTEAVRYDVDADGICTLTMDVPGQTMNTLGTDLSLALRAAIDRAAADPAVHGIILASGKPAFLAGADLKEMDAGTGVEDASAEERARALGSLSRDLRHLETCGKPVACAINGVAAGGGLEMALACHHRVVADDPGIRLGLPEVSVGLMPGGGGTQRLPRLLGIAAALPLLLQGSLVTAAKALELGIVDAVVPRDELIDTARRWLLTNPAPAAPWDQAGFAIPGGGPAEAGQILSISNAMTKAGTFGNLPAPSAILAAVFEGAKVPFDTALRVESRYFATLFSGDVARAMIRTLFVSKQAADKLVMRPAGVPASDHTRIGILGAGTMGSGLALAAARAGLGVVLIDTSQEKAAAGRDYARGRLDRDVARARTTPELAAETLARIDATDDYGRLAGLPIVIEAVFEDRAVKEGVIKQAGQVLPDDAVLASNTSAMPITALAGFSGHPETFIGMHFFSPAERMPLVEIIRGEQTSDETLARALDLAKALRKTPIVVNDSPGFFTSRFIGSFIGEGMRMIEAGVNPHLVENGARMLGMPMGPMTIQDSVGLDLTATAGEQHRKDTGAGGTSPPLGIGARLSLEFGRHGRKNGQGFYDYGPDGTAVLWPGLANLLPRLGEQPDIAEVKQRILYAQLAEGARAFAEGVLPAPSDGDLGAVLGVGFPAYLGGPFVAMDTVGLPAVVKELDRLAAAHGEQFAVPDRLREMAARGDTFYGRGARR